MKGLSAFQMVIIAVFIVFIVVGTLIFSGILPGFRPPAGGEAGELVLWGTVPEVTMRPIMEAFNDTYEASFTLVYVEKNPTTLERDFVEAKADNQAPDLLIFPHEFGLTQRTRLVTLPPEFVSARDYQDTFVPAAAELYLGLDGALALPLVVDPLVLYYNETLLTNAGLATVPKTWTEFIQRTRDLTMLDERRNITQSAIALGETRNIDQAKNILAMLLLQAGNPIVRSSTVPGESWQSQLNESLGYTLKPAIAVLDFFIQFSDPSRPNYAWNRSLPEARQVFLRGQSAFYLGLASEYPLLKRQNPNLNFDVALPPQREEGSRVTLGRLLSVAAVSDRPKVSAAASAALALASAETAGALAGALGLPPARRDLLTQGSADPVQAVFYPAALAARTWFDPAPAETEQIFHTLIEAVVTGRLRTSEAVAEADRMLDNLLDQLYGRDD